MNLSLGHRIGPGDPLLSAFVFIYLYMKFKIFIRVSISVLISCCNGQKEGKRDKLTGYVISW